MNNFMFRAVLSIFTFSTLLCISCNNAAPGSESSNIVLDESYYTDKYNYTEKSTLLGRGINMGNYFEYNSESALVNDRVMSESDFERISNAGFQSVRIPVCWTAHCDTSSPYSIDETFINRVKSAVNWALLYDLNVVITAHNYFKMMEDNESSLSYHQSRLNAVWSQLCKEFPLSEYNSTELVFELLNEPFGTVDSNTWNNMIDSLTDVIWNLNSETQNTNGYQRRVIIGTAEWNHPNTITNLSLPSACTPNNTLITVHFYEPMGFTHQGADWIDPIPGNNAQWIGDDEDRQYVLDFLNNLTSWNNSQPDSFEIYIGEFGVYSLYVEKDQQKAWTAFVAREAENRDMSWAYWEYSKGFGAYDPEAGEWHSHLLEVLIPLQNPP